MNTIAKILDDSINGAERPKKFGFALMVFDFGDGPHRYFNWISNSERIDVIAAMREFIAKNGQSQDIQ